jgi:hypothetical protein
VVVVVVAVVVVVGGGGGGVRMACVRAGRVCVWIGFNGRWGGEGRGDVSTWGGGVGPDRVREQANGYSESRTRCRSRTG